MTDTPETAEWEPDEDTGTDAPRSDAATETDAPRTDQQPPPGMKYDPSGKLLVDDGEPRTREQKYRQQLRATETERDQLRERLERRDRADVERMITTKLIDPADLWHVVSLADCLDPETGEISPQLVDEAVTRVVKQHPHWRFNSAAPASQVTAPHGGVEERPAPTWQSVFQQATRPE
jgi:hypothetical protein